MRNAKDLSIARLDAVEKLSPGTGALSVFGFTRGGLESGLAGGGLDYEHRINREISTFANGLVGHGWGVYEPFAWEAKAGLRWRW